MDSHIPPSHLAEDPKASPSRKSTSSSTKSIKPVHRVTKRAGPNAAATHHHDHITHGTGMDGRHKRVWKACERCRTKKTKCDGEFPCKRCKDDGLVCTAGVRKKMKYKQLPRGYAEVLENTQFALIATVHKLYSMILNSQQWDLGEPDLNDQGLPVIHNIAQKLGCIRSKGDIDLPVHSVFPEDERGMRELAVELEEQQRLETEANKDAKDTNSSSYSELDHCDLVEDTGAPAFGRHNDLRSSNSCCKTMTMSPQCFTTNSTDFELSQAPPELESQAMLPTTSGNNSGPIMPTFAIDPVSSIELQRQMMLNQGIVKSDFDFINPHVLSCPNPEIILGMGDPMIYSGLNSIEISRL